MGQHYHPKIACTRIFFDIVGPLAAPFLPIFTTTHPIPLEQASMGPFKCRTKLDVVHEIFRAIFGRTNFWIPFIGLFQTSTSYDL